MSKPLMMLMFTLSLCNKHMTFFVYHVQHDLLYVTVNCHIWCLILASQWLFYVTKCHAVDQFCVVIISQYD